MYRQSRVVVEAPAKINLFLDITGRLENGYHLLDTIMQAIDLSDLIVVGRTETPGIRVSCSRRSAPEDRSNLACRAAEAFLGAAGVASAGLHIHIDKAIPAQAGLGGGSSDAAAVLAGMNELFGTGCPPETLCEIGAAIGADVPFLVRGGCAGAAGIGEKLTPLSPGLRPCWIAVAKPSGGVDTAKAYAAYDTRPDLVHGASQGIRSALAAGDLAATGRGLFNVFEQLSDSPQTERIKSVMLAYGALGAALTGSGSAVYGLFEERRAAEACRSALSAPDIATFLARPAEHGAKILHLG